MTDNKTQNLILVTTTRADWGILSPLARALTLHPGVKLTIAAGNMHLSPKYGMTINEIRAEGFDNVVELSAPETDDSAASRTEISARTAISLARVISDTHPDGVIILGDRYEMLGAAMAALIANVPIVHLHGGEISEGAIDDSVRHALTKMASLHLAATEKAVERIKALGEEPMRIVHTGSIGVENVLNTERLTREELKEKLDGFDIDPSKTLLLTFHPVTRHPGNISAEVQIDNILGALEDVPETNAIITYPNNDTGSNIIIERLKNFAEKYPERIKLIQSLGKLRYINALNNCLAVIGNTSSGILEAPSSTAVTIDIGPRQQGRERAKSVIHVEDDREAITEAIRQVLSNRNTATCTPDNPYYRPNAVATAVDAIVNLLGTLPCTKKFPQI